MAGLTLCLSRAEERMTAVKEERVSEADSVVVAPRADFQPLSGYLAGPRAAGKTPP